MEDFKMKNIDDILPGDIAIYDWSDDKSSALPPSSESLRYVYF
jgi:uncharacterized protein YfaT (DUF1175 family)